MGPCLDLGAKVLTDFGPAVTRLPTQSLWCSCKVCEGFGLGWEWLKGVNYGQRQGTAEISYNAQDALT